MIIEKQNGKEGNRVYIFRSKQRKCTLLNQIHIMTRLMPVELVLSENFSNYKTWRFAKHGVTCGRAFKS